MRDLEKIEENLLCSLNMVEKLGFTEFHLLSDDDLPPELIDEAVEIISAKYKDFYDDTDNSFMDICLLAWSHNLINQTKGDKEAMVKKTTVSTSAFLDIHRNIKTLSKIKVVDKNNVVTLGTVSINGINKLPQSVNGKEAQEKYYKDINFIDEFKDHECVKIYGQFVLSGTLFNCTISGFEFFEICKNLYEKLNGIPTYSHSIYRGISKMLVQKEMIDIELEYENTYRTHIKIVVKNEIFYVFYNIDKSDCNKLN